MSPHKKIYCKAFGFDSSDYIGCSICANTAVDVHAIIADGMGGRPNKETHRIENLIALCRDCHVKYGDKKQYKPMLFEMQRRSLIVANLNYDQAWINKQIING